MRKLKPVEIARPSPDEVRALSRHPVAVLADNIRSLYNVGAFFRTSDAALIEHVYLTGVTGTPDHHALHKTALGAQDTVPWSHHRDPLEVLHGLREKGYTLAALEITDRPTSLSELTLRHFPLCLIVGNELHGISDAVLEQADLAIEIPQFGSKHSLNAAVAFGIAAYDLVRRYRQLAGLPE